VCSTSATLSHDRSPYPPPTHTHATTHTRTTQIHARCPTCHVQQVDCLIDLEHLMVGGAAYLGNSAAADAAATVQHHTRLWDPTAGNLPTSKSLCCPVSTAQHRVEKYQPEGKPATP
jgi:hypothetical protein